MSDSKTTLERIAHRIPVPEPAHERFQHRHDRRRRNQRVAAGLLGMALFVSSVWIVRDVASRDTTSVPGGAGTGPAVTGAGGREAGDLIGHYGAYAGDVFVYADGRVIWSAGDMPADELIQLVPNSRSLHQRRLTADAVELVRSGAIDVADLYPPFYLPANVWADAETKPYVPSRYAFCFSLGGASDPGTVNGGYQYPSTVLPFFPPAARAILRGDMSADPECSAVTDAEALALDAMLKDIHVVDAEGDPIGWEVAPILPHGAPLLCLGCY